MANWYYYDKKGEKIAVNAKQLQALAQKGIITPKTIIETAEGKTVPAKKVKGLTFVEAKKQEPVKPVEAETYGLASPPPLVDEFGLTPSFQKDTPSNYVPPANTTPVSSNGTFKRPSGTTHQTVQKPTFWDWLFLDFRFRFFLTPILLKIIWCMWVVVVELLIVMLILGLIFVMLANMLPSSTPEPNAMLFRASSMPGNGSGSMSFLLMRLLPIILIPTIVVTFLLCIRVVLESVMIVFRIGEHLKSIDEKM